MNKLSWYLKGTGAFGWRYRLMAILTKAFYHLHLISEQDAIGYAKGLHNMWMMESRKGRTESSKGGYRGQIIKNEEILCAMETISYYGYRSGG